MNKAMACLGWLVFVLFVLGALNLIDFHVCAAAVGACPAVKSGGST